MMRIAVTGSMGQVPTSLIVQAGREFEIVLLGRAYSCSRIALLFSLGRGGQRRCLHRRRPSRRVVRSTGFRLLEHQACVQTYSAVSSVSCGLRRRRL